MKKKEEFLKEAYRPLSESGVGGISGLEQLNHPGWVGLDRFERELMYGLADPAHEAKLRNIRVQTILTDLMNTDPYLKDKDPEEVIDAMNDIMEINPDLHKNKPMLRLALRQYLESGGMDIPTLGVLSEFGKEERERKSREKGQRESAAQQFASQQESARQADEKLRSEEMRANNELELKKKEYELKEKEFAKKYPELEEHKGLVRRLVSMGMSLGEIAHNIRHPLQATNEAFTREWTREQRKRNLDRNEEDTELSKREAEQRGAHNNLMRAILDEGKLNIDIRNMPQDEATYQQEKTMKQRRTDQEFNDLDAELQTKHNQTLINANSAAQNRFISDVEATQFNDPTYQDALTNQIKSKANIFKAQNTTTKLARNEEMDTWNRNMQYTTNRRKWLNDKMNATTEAANDALKNQKTVNTFRKMFKTTRSIKNGY